jgi:hypothetical protein
MDNILRDTQFQKDLKMRKAEFDGHDEDDDAPEEDNDEAPEKHNPIRYFSEAHQALVHLIRGFVMNPEVMLMHRPFVHFHDEEIQNRMEIAMLQQRDNRGFLMPEESVWARRPRTLFMSIDDEDRHESMADLVWHLPEFGAKAKQYVPLKSRQTSFYSRSHVEELEHLPISCATSLDHFDVPLHTSQEDAPLHRPLRGRAEDAPFAFKGPLPAIGDETGAFDALPLSSRRPVEELPTLMSLLSTDSHREAYLEAKRTTRMGRPVTLKTTPAVVQYSVGLK